MAKLYFNYGVMSSSKTAQALMTKFKYEQDGKRVILIKPSIDTRDGDNIIKSRVGISSECVYIEEVIKMTEHEVNKCDIFIVDEAQFLTLEEVKFLANLVDTHEKTVICYGLKSDYTGKLFSGSEALLVYADKISEIKTTCWCGRKATMNALIDKEGKVIKSGEQVIIGGDDKYISLCRKHWIKGDTGHHNYRW